jgi:nucleoside-diphosphate-sugar epimerase
MAGGRIAVIRALVIGGTGLISRGIVKHLLVRGAEVTVFNRGKFAGPTLPSDVRTVLGDRDDADALWAAAGEKFDVVIDMVCFPSKQAAAAVAAFGGKCQHYIFCSTVCTYGTASPSTVLIDESSPQQPTSDYGRNKVACEQMFFAAHRARRFAITNIRPSQTYGPGGPMIDNLEFDPVGWDRIDRGLCAPATGWATGSVPTATTAASCPLTQPCGPALTARRITPLGHSTRPGPNTTTKCRPH